MQLRFFNADILDSMSAFCDRIIFFVIVRSYEEMIAWKTLFFPKCWWHQFSSTVYFNCHLKKKRLMYFLDFHSITQKCGRKNTLFDKIGWDRQKIFYLQILFVASFCVYIRFRLSKVRSSVTMLYKRFCLIFQCFLMKLTMAQDMRSTRFSTINDRDINCATTYCLPYVNSTVLNIRRCEINCLVGIQCKAAVYRRSTSVCQLFTREMNPTLDMMTNTDCVSLLVIGGTRNPPS